MPRASRQWPGGYVYHIWNRAAGRLRLFKKPSDYEAFERVLFEAQQRHPIALLDWCLMPNHWHFVVYPDDDDQISAFFRWLTHTHAMRAITHRRVLGMGPLYQGRYKSLPAQHDNHLLTLLRYVERNPVRAKLVRRAEDWRWGSAFVRQSKDHRLFDALSPWPVDPPVDWKRWVNQPQTADEENSIRECVRRSRPFGTAAWTMKTAAKLGIEHTTAKRGRPPKTVKAE